ncbi:ROK family protein [Pseudoclavibacter sp. 13-3]|uniref:ROK family protein n=1 Tax=Pseudoclavibacter sp. 13-3 TaxID=2901228 RepID=UPI001E2CBECA|nr:ROK family protein [Pseudoclavibacter sp. 13-3]
MAQAIGIDVGGTGIKAAIVDTTTGDLLSDRLTVETPQQATPEQVVSAAQHLVGALLEQPAVLGAFGLEGVAARDAAAGGWNIEMPIGVALPSVVVDGITLSAANVSAQWIGHDAAAHFSRAFGVPVAIVNDADAAGWAEAHSGVARGQRGLTIVTTLGTGIGSALIQDGLLIPNTELGHLEIDGEPDYERVASPVARERDGVSFADWGARLSRFYQVLERLFSPRLFVIGGGISSAPELFLPHLDVRTPVRIARYDQNAGIIGAAEFAVVTIG